MIFNPAADLYFEELDYEFSELSQELRVFVFAIIPELTEKMKYGIPFYHFKKDLFYLCIQKKKLILGIVQGAKLNARPGLIKAEDRKQIRHLEFRTKDDIYRDEVVEVLLEAKNLNS